MDKVGLDLERSRSGLVIVGEIKIVLARLDEAEYEKERLDEVG